MFALLILNSHHYFKANIMKTLSKKFLVIVVSMFFCTVSHAHKLNNSAPPPPKLEKLEEVTEADIKVLKPKTDKLKMKERKEGGVTKEVEVTSGKSTYVVKPNPAPTGTREGDAVRPAMWKVKEFGGKKEMKDAQDIDSKALPVLPAGKYSTSKMGVTKPVFVEANEKAASASASASASVSSVKQ
jgi:hypothetical protein